MKSLMKSSKPKLVAKDAQVQFSLPVAGVLRDVQSAFFGLCVGAGKAVLSTMMEEDRVALCGPKGVPDCARSAYRGGHTRSWVTLGGRRITVARPRARPRDAAELGLPTFAWAGGIPPSTMVIEHGIAPAFRTLSIGGMMISEVCDAKEAIQR